MEDADGHLLDPFPTSISRDKGLALYDLIRRTHAINTLEIGMAYGLSTLFMCQAHSDNGGGHHVAIDPAQSSRWQSIGLLNVKKAGLDHHLSFYEGPSCEVLPRLVLDQERFDFVFIDGKHVFDYALTDFFYADKLLNAGGHIMFDDLWMPSIRKVCGYVLRNRNYELAAQFVQKPFLRWRNTFILARNVVQSPFDIYSLCLSGYLLAKGFSTYCVIKKISTDNRAWDHYKPF